MDFNFNFTASTIAFCRFYKEKHYSSKVTSFVSFELSICLFVF